MAKIYLDANDTSFIVANNNSEVSGTAAAETLVINAGVTGTTVSNSIDDVDFAGAVADYQFRQVPGSTTVEVLDAQGTVLATVATSGQTLSFSDGTATLAATFDPDAGTTGVTLGDTAITETAAAVVPAVIDAADVSSNAGNGGQDPVDPVEPEFDLAGALTTLQTAQTEEAEFLNDQVDNDLLSGLNESSTLEQIRTAIDTAASVANTALVNARGVTSDNVLNAQLQDAQADLTAAEDAAGADLLADIEASVAADAALETATSDQVDTAAEAAGAVATFDALAARDDDSANAEYLAPKAGDKEVAVVTDIGDNNAAMISVNAEGDLVIADAYANTTGINALFAAVSADVAAIEAKAAAQEAADEAAAVISAADEEQVVTDLTTMTTAISGAGWTDEATTEAVVTDATAAAVTAGALTAEQKTAIDTAFADALTVENDLATAKTAAEDVYAPIVTAAEEAVTEAEADVALATAYGTALTALETKQAEVDARAELVADAAATATLNTDADALATAVSDAEQALTDEDYAVVSIDEADEAGTAADDIFLVGDTASAITGFELTTTDAEGATSGDSLFVGTDFTLVVAAEGETTADNLGDVSVLEAILVDDGTDTTIYFEQQSFAGNGSTAADLLAIELTGVTGGTASIDAEGFLTVA